MPYEDDYREAAHRYRVMSEHLLQEAGPSGGWVLGFMGAGPVSEAVVASVERIRTRLARAGAELRHLAQTCDERADVCAGYARDLVRFNQLSWAERRRAVAPQRPARWADA